VLDSLFLVFYISNKVIEYNKIESIKQIVEKRKIILSVLNVNYNNIILRQIVISRQTCLLEDLTRSIVSFLFIDNIKSLVAN